MAKKNTAAEAVKGIDDWELDRDLDALTRSEAIKKDPGRHQKVKAHAKKKLDEYHRKIAEGKAGVKLAKSA